MMSGFTKGPWKVTSTGDIGIDIDAPYYEALGVGVNEESPFCVIISRRHVASRLEANAHLIAAAPDLYEALTELVEAGTNSFNAIKHYGEINNTTDAVSHILSNKLDKAIYALAKARGEL